MPSCEKAGLIFQHAIDGFLHHLLRVGAILASDARKLRLLLE